MRKNWLLLIFTLFLCGVVATIAGFAGFFFSWLSVLLLLPIAVLSMFLATLLPKIVRFSKTEKSIVGLLVVWWVLHLVQVFVPETGFDAVWYHLPVAQGVLERHAFFADTNLYQSFNPLFSDSVFFLGYAVLGELGAKVVAYLFDIALIGSSYFLARVVIPRPFALVVVLLISGFQVVSWQSSSFYVDVAKAFWEVSALFFLLNSDHFSQLKSFAVLGASLASKAFSTLLLPLFMVIAFPKSKRLVFYAAVSLCIALPYILFSYQATGQWFYTLSHHFSKLGEIGGEPRITSYLVSRITALPSLPLEFLFTREYTSPLLLLFFPLAVIFRRKIFVNRVLWQLTLFSLGQLLVWWFVPPLSVRYAVSGFIVMTILTVYFLLVAAKRYHFSFTRLLVLLMIAGVLFMPVRLLIVKRSFQYLLGQQTKQQYIEQFLDGSIDDKLRAWHQLAS